MRGGDAFGPQQWSAMRRSSVLEHMLGTRGSGWGSCWSSLAVSPQTENGEWGNKPGFCGPLVAFAAVV